MCFQIFPVFLNYPGILSLWACTTYSNSLIFLLLPFQLFLGLILHGLPIASFLVKFIFSTVKCFTRIRAAQIQSLSDECRPLPPSVCFQAALCHFSRVLVPPLVISNMDHIPPSEKVSRIGKLILRVTLYRWQVTASLLQASYIACQGNLW